MVPFVLAQTLDTSLSYWAAPRLQGKLTDKVRFEVHVAGRMQTEVTASSSAAGLLLITLAATPLLLHLTSRPVDARTLSLFLLVGLAGATLVLTSSLRSAALAGGRNDYIGISTSVGTLAALIAFMLALPTLGIVALGAYQLVSAVVGRLVLRAQVLHSIGGPVRLLRRPSLRMLCFSFRELAGSWLLSGSGALVTSADVIFLAAIAGPAAAGSYRLGALIPTQMATIFYQGFDTSFPYVSGAETSEDACRVIFRLSMLLITMLGGSLSLIALARFDIARLLVGHGSSLTARFVGVFALAWAINGLAHGWGLYVLARRKQSALIGLVAGEAAANVAITGVGVALGGPIWAGWATCISYGVSNAVLLPIILGRALLPKAPKRTLQLVPFGGVGAGIGVGAWYLASGRNAIVHGALAAGLLVLAFAVLLTAAYWLWMRPTSWLAHAIARPPQGDGGERGC